MRFTEIRIAVMALVAGTAIGWSMGARTHDSPRSPDSAIGKATGQLIVSIPEADRRHSYILNVVRTGTSHHSDDPDPKNWRIVLNGDHGTTFLEAEVAVRD